MIEKKIFGKLNDSREVFLYSLNNESGTRVNIINYGAIVTHLFVKDRSGKIADVVSGYDSIDGYVHDRYYFGAIVGRCGNRIAKGKFKLDGKEIQLTINDGENHLHGGRAGFNKVLWQATPLETEFGCSLKLTYVSPDGEEGYPGTVTLTVTYSLSRENELAIKYEGRTDKTTILNPTHHSYFNLTGDFTKPILKHELAVHADKFTPVDQSLIPTGKVAVVDGTPMDFRTPTLIGLRINDNYEQLKLGGGYDHNFVLNDYDLSIRKVAALYDPLSGILMDVLTDHPGLQFYSGNFLDGKMSGKGGMAYQKRTALCLETQHYPDSPNNSNFPSVILEPGEIYQQTTIYKFSTK